QRLPPDSPHGGQSRHVPDDGNRPPAFRTGIPPSAPGHLLLQGLPLQDGVPRGPVLRWTELVRRPCGAQAHALAPGDRHGALAGRPGIPGAVPAGGIGGGGEEIRTETVVAGRQSAWLSSENGFGRESQLAAATENSPAWSNDGMPVRFTL